MSEETSGASVQPPAAPSPASPRDEESQALKATQGAFDKAREMVRSPAFNPFGGSRLVLALLAWDRRLIPVSMLETLLRAAERAGHWGIVAAQVLCVFFCLAASVKMSEWKYVGFGAGSVVLLAVLQFLAERFLAQNRQTVEATPVRLGSSGLPDAVALAAELAGLLLFASFFMQAKAYSQWGLVGIGLAIWVLMDLFAHLALNPSSVNLSFSAAPGAGDEALGIAAFLFNALLRLASAVFAVGVIAGNAYLVAAFFPLLRDMTPEPGLATIRIIALSAAAPFLAYLAFVVGRLGIELMQACLDTPRRLAGGSPNKER